MLAGLRLATGNLAAKKGGKALLAALFKNGFRANSIDNRSGLDFQQI